jgi:heterodisulfide reductase subunit A
MRIGIYVCECGINIAQTVDVARVTSLCSKLPNIKIARYYKYLCSEPGQQLIKKDIKELKLDRVVVASCSPRLHELTFRNAVQEGGLNPYCFEMTNIREHCSWVHEDKEKATEKALALIRAAAARATLLEPLEPKKVSVIPKALVLGGGIAGIQASLDLANAGYKVYLVELAPSLGGRTVQLSKIFPLERCADSCTGSCFYCFLLPKIVDCYRHENIEIYTSARVEALEGYVGNFRVRIHKKATYVDNTKCINCGKCIEACILKEIPNELDFGMSKRAAIYTLYPSPIPTYSIDREKCLYFANGTCKSVQACRKVCNCNAIDFEQKDEKIQLEVGAVIVATGYDLYTELKPFYGYEYPEVITGLELERLFCLLGPTKGEILVDGKKPKEIVFIQCVGSREKAGNQYCSRICCMYTAKQALELKRKLKNANVTVLYTDLRTFGKGHEEFLVKAQASGVKYIRRELDETIKVEKTDNQLYVYTKTNTLAADLVVLATAMVPRREVKELARVLNITQSQDSFFLEAHPKLRPLDTFCDGIYLAGCCQAPKDIPDTIAQASGAASKAINLFAKKAIETESIVAKVNEGLCTGCGLCLELCSLGAIELKLSLTIGRIAKVNDALCKGCGVCAAGCSSGAIQQAHFQDRQMINVIDGLVA